MENDNPIPSPQGTTQRGLFFRIARNLLHWWIRPTVLDCDAETLGLNLDLPVCYVLQQQSLADPLVLDQACEHGGLPSPLAQLLGDAGSSLLFLGHAEGTLGRRVLRGDSPHLSSLLALARTGQDIQIVPVSLFWGHQPDQEQSVFKLILSENWTATSRVRKLLAMLLHRRHILVEFGAHISAVQLARSEPDIPKQSRKLGRILRAYFRRQRQAIIGPDLSHRRTLINTVLTSNNVVRAIEREAGRKGLPVHEIETRARDNANEIVSHLSYGVIRLFHFVLTWLWHRLYDGINVQHVGRLKDAARSFELVYIPCHRSHIDYLLLSYVLYHNGLTPPHIAAGRNLNLPILGSLLRRAGAFFMRRSFQGDLVYKAVFDEYLHLMLVKGYSVEYFIEGGRSRTGRTLTPRTGMLSMTMRSQQRSPGTRIALMPVYFGYERILEGSTYLGELQGEEKKDESVWDVLPVLRTLKDPFGEVSVNFGEPIVLDEFMDTTVPNWRDATGDNPSPNSAADPGVANTRFSTAAGALASALATRINGTAAINAVNVVALALLATPRQVMETSDLAAQVDLLLQLSRDVPYGPAVTITPLSSHAIVDHAIEVAGLTRTVQSFGEVVSAGPRMSVLLTYYRNNVAHLFALPSLLARLIRLSDSATRATIRNRCHLLYPFVRAEFHLHWPIATLDAQITRYLDGIARLDLISDSASNDDEKLMPAPQASAQHGRLYYLGEITGPTVERFFIVLALLDGHSFASLKNLEAAASGIAERLSSHYRINSPEFFDHTLFGSFSNELKELGYFTVTGGTSMATPNLSNLRQACVGALDAEVRYNVLHAVARYRETAAESTTT